MINKVKEPNLKSGMLYLLNNNTIHKAIKNPKKTLAIIKKAREEDNEPWTLQRGNIFPNEKALKSAPNEKLIFDIQEDNEVVGNFNGFLYPNETLNGKIIWRIDLQTGSEHDILNGYYKKYSEFGIELYGFWTDIDGTEGFYGYLSNDRPARSKIIKKAKKTIALKILKPVKKKRRK